MTEKLEEALASICEELVHSIGDELLKEYSPLRYLNPREIIKMIAASVASILFYTLIDHKSTNKTQRNDILFSLADEISLTIKRCGILKEDLESRKDLH